jgi:hypothetical protein
MFVLIVMIPSIGVLINPLPSGPGAKQEQRLCRDERRAFARFTKEAAGNMTKKMRRIPQHKINIIDKQLLAGFGELPRVQLNRPTKPQA